MKAFALASRAPLKSGRIQIALLLESWINHFAERADGTQPTAHGPELVCLCEFLRCEEFVQILLTRANHFSSTTSGTEHGNCFPRLAALLKVFGEGFVAVRTLRLNRLL